VQLKADGLRVAEIEAQLATAFDRWASSRRAQRR